MTKRRFGNGILFRAAAGLALAIVAAIAAFGSFDAPADPWRRALPPYEFQFNRDHASHPDYKVEWWYYTGNLRASDGRQFGYQLTFFRVGVDFRPVNPSRWAVRDLYMTHLAVTEIDGGRFRNAERINRAGIGWAGAETTRYRVWNEDWTAEQLDSGRHRLRAIDAEIGVDFELDEGKPAVASRSKGSAGWITSSARAFWRRGRWAGTGSRSSSTTMPN